MKELIIEIEGKEYQVKEPTLKDWALLNVLKDLEQEEDFSLSIVSITTGIDEDLLRETNYIQVKKAADFLAYHFIELGQKFYPEFNFKDQDYKFIDLNNMSFGHFVDIDNFLTLDESYKRGNMNELMAMLYMEKDEVKYSVDKVNQRKEIFKELPVKYLQGSLRFFFLLKKRLQENTPFYLRIKWKVKRKLRRLREIGVGMVRLFIWRVKT